MRLRRVPLVSLVALLAALFLVPSTSAGTTPRVLAIELENDINPVTEDYVVGELERAERDRYAAVVIVLDTPGGLDSSMRAIIKKELDLKVPVVVYVAPAGARAASAGAFIAMAADVAAMAPQTNIGSATPVDLSGQDIQKDLRNKIVNDAKEYIRALAEEHGRNGAVAESFVTEGSNLRAREALERNVVDVVAPDLRTLLDRIDGTRLKTKPLVVRTEGARVEHVEMSRWKRVLDLLVDGNVIAILLSVGLLGIVVELWNPGLIFPGTVGVISLIVGLFGLQVLPVSWAGLLLMLLAAAFFAAELFVASHGALALAGAASFVVGALMLFDPAGETYQVSLPVALAVGGMLALAFALALGKVVQARRRPVAIGEQSIVGARGQVRRDGLVFVHGELWRAHSLDGQPLVPGSEVEVARVEGDLVLAVRPLASA